MTIFHGAEILPSDIDIENIGYRIMTDIRNKCGNNAHPRLILTESDFERYRQNRDNGTYKILVDSLLKSADEYLGTEPLDYHIPDGIRLLQVSRGVLSRIKTLSLAYNITLDEKYARRAVSELKNAASFSDWNPYHFLDVGEMCEAFAIGYDWLYNYMDQSDKKILRDAMVSHGFCAIMDDYLDNAERKRSYRWYQDDPGDNWKFVCNGGVGSAVLAIFDEDDVDSEMCARILAFGFADSYKAVRDMYMPDGSYTEGFTYWVYASNYLAYFVSALMTSAGSDYGLTDYEPVRKSAYYVKYMCSNTFQSFNFGDAADTNLCYPLFLWYGKNYGEYELSSIRSDYINEIGFSKDADDFLWYNHKEYKPYGNLGLQYGSVGGANASFRSGWHKDDLYGAIHFGENDAYHGQSDTGVFVVEYGGKRFFSDLGQDNYNVGNYKNAYRYRAEGHNTLVINPSAQNDQARDSRCYINTFVKGEGEGASFALCDMSDAYYGKKVIRGMKMEHDGSALTVQDKIELEPGDSGYWFAHTKADISLSDDCRCAVLAIDGVRLNVHILTSGHTFEVMEAKLLDDSILQTDQLDNSQYQKLAIRFEGSTEISVAFVPDVDNRNDVVKIPEFIETDKW